MRSEVKIGLALTALLVAVTAAGAASIKNTKHDLSSGSTGATFKATNTDQICVFCHTPHNAQQDIPLWNRGNPTASNFTLYSSSSMNNVPVKQGFTADSISLFCMSCHDGATGLGGAVHNDPNGVAITMVGGNDLITGEANLGNDLSNDHPVNFEVTPAGIAADGNLGALDTGTNPPTMKTADVTNGLPLFKSARGATTLECGSCHKVHDNTDAPFLRTTMAGSKLCLGCHKK
ncbi:cytochrome c3 family protein [Geobacter sulfurreducens subsp. ethanolicus]|uniref:cytochrome c3 family protein n=1 Tax=Geobacter sulfurreducens TaxID=35554 RepID=UPI002572C9D8|nr:cytochrome c3 family protein [Geobacter sulfurreducens]BEH09152.1 cytochrome c3 family protein [Geobacter sulfurreducens subsp. ethanolicus]